MAEHNKAEFPQDVTLNVGGKQIKITLYEKRQYKIHSGECPVETVSETGDSSS